MNPNDIAVREVEWVLQEAYKIAVRVAGIKDWSEEPPETKQIVNNHQMEIAKMIHQSLMKRL